jgi:hypothetical protein
MRFIHQFNDPAGAKSFFAAGIGGQRGQHGQDLNGDAHAAVSPVREVGYAVSFALSPNRGLVIDPVTVGSTRQASGRSATVIARVPGPVLIGCGGPGCVVGPSQATSKRAAVNVDMVACGGH